VCEMDVWFAMNKLTKTVYHQQQRPNLAEALAVCSPSGLLILSRKLELAVCTQEALQILKLNGAAAKATFEQLPLALQKTIRQTLASSKPFADKTIRIPSGTVRVTIRALPAAGKIQALAVVVQDPQALARADGNLRQLDRLSMIGTLSASMAHEIKNALVAGKTFIDLLLEKNQDAELAGIVRRELGRIDGIVSQVLKLASPAKPAFSPVRLHETLDHSLRLVQHHLEERAIALHRSYAAPSDLIGGDDFQLQQAFVNLFLNALEAMPQNGDLYVSTEFASPKRSSRALNGARSPQLRIMIKDTGPGISPENLGHLFEPFFTTKPNGTGLGLPITQRIIKEHRGDITVESELNKGATFNIMLPALKR
jgi:signal transduction histidine kinase